MKIKIFTLTLAYLMLISCGGSSNNTGSTGNIISGIITPSAYNQVDGDTNNKFSNSTPNSTFATAQSINNPVLLGGYVEDDIPSGTETVSNLDISDIYKVSLVAGQKIVLDIANLQDENNDRDLDMYLYPNSCTDSTCSSNNCNDYAEGKGGSINRSVTGNSSAKTEEITAPSNGDFFLEVCGFLGDSNYTLIINSNTGSLSTTSLPPAYVTPTINNKFIPGDVIVKFKENKSFLKYSNTNALTIQANRVGLLAKGGGYGRSMLMQLGNSNQRALAFNALGIKTSNSVNINALTSLKMDTLAVIEALNKRTDVEYAEPNYIVRASAIPNDEYYGSYQWHYPLINLPQAWDITKGSTQVIVAVVDTGVVLNHPDFAGQLVSGYDFIQDTDTANDGGGIDSNPNDPGDSDYGSSFHGTHVAGTIAAKTNNGTGVAGVGWNTKVMPIRVLGVGGGTSYDVIQGVRYAAGLSNDSGTTLSSSQRADIINLSLGGGGYSQSSQETYTAAYNNGVIIIAASGNEKTSVTSYPAGYTGVVSVSAVNKNKELADYSNYGSKIDISAPGGGHSGGVYSAVSDDYGTYRYASYQGTSMAAPHVAGVVALMKAVDPDLTPAKLDGFISSGRITQDLGTSGRDNSFGHGLIDALKAVEVAGGGSTAANLIAAPNFLNFGINATQLELTLSNSGEGVLNNITVTDNQNWLSVSGSGLGVHTVTINRSNLDDGIYNAVVTITSSENTVKIPINVQVGGEIAGSNLGIQHVILRNSDTNKTIASKVININDNGQYVFSFTGVELGNYHIISGSDIDGDGFMCDSGEACGAYITLDQPAIITTSNNELNFSARFSNSVTSVSGANFSNNNKLKVYSISKKHAK